MAGGPPSPAKRSFLDLFNSTSSELQMPLKESSTYRGEPALKYSADEIETLACSLKFALVGKFSQGRPSMEALRKNFGKIDLKGSVKLGLLDRRHILIRAENEEDFLRFRLRKFWSFDGFVMRVFKWTPDFRTDIESPLVPVWVSFESLPLFMFNKASLFSLARIIGVPLKIDAATSDLSRPSVARVCVEIDLRKELPKRLWLDIGSVGFWQSILYDDLPKYCQDCCKIGHLAADCRCSKVDSQKGAVNPSLPKTKWIPKMPQAHPHADKIVVSSTQIAAKAFHVAGHLDAVENSSPVFVTEQPPPIVAAAAAAETVTATSENTSSTSHVAVPRPVLTQAVTQSDAAEMILAAASPAFTKPVASSTTAPGQEAHVPAPAIPVLLSADAAAVLAAAAAAVPVAAAIPDAAAAPVATTSVVVAAVLVDAADAAAVPVSTAVAESARADVIRADAANVLAAVRGSPADSVTDAKCADASPAKDEVLSVDDSAVAMNKTNAAEADVSAPKFSGLLNPNASLFSPQINPFANLTKSFAEVLLDGPQTANVSVEPLFFAIKSTEFPSFQLPQFAEFYTSSSFNPTDETNCSKIRDDIYTFSDGDDVPRWPASRDVILNSLQSFHKKLLDKFSKRRRYFRCPIERKKWKKLAPISSPGPAMSSIVPPPLNALTFHGPNPLEDQSDDNAPSVWRSSSSDEDNGIDFTIPLASEAAFMALEYEDFSPPARRKYNKRFRDLPAPMTTRSFRNRF